MKPTKNHSLFAVALWHIYALSLFHAHFVRTKRQVAMDHIARTQYSLCSNHSRQHTRTREVSDVHNARAISLSTEHKAASLVRESKGLNSFDLWPPSVDNLSTN